MAVQPKEPWENVLEPWDTVSRMLMALLHVLRSKGVVDLEDFQALTDYRYQEFVSEREAREGSHTPQLPTAELAQMAGVGSGMLVLDAGCGYGGPARELAEDFGARVIGVDRDPLRVLYAIQETARKGMGGRVRFCWGDFKALPFPDALFDFVWSMESLTGHDLAWRDDVPTGLAPDLFKEFARVLKPSGRVACQLFIRGPVDRDDLRRFLDMTSFTLVDMDDCTETWLRCMLESIENLREDNPRKQSWQVTHDEAVRRGDRLYRFVARRS